jgi:hypothetical protein
MLYFLRARRISYNQLAIRIKIIFFLLVGGEIIWERM